MWFMRGKVGQSQAELPPVERVEQEVTLERGGDMAHTQLNQEDHAPGPRKSGRDRRQPRRLEDYHLGGLHNAVQDPPPGRR